MQHWLELLGLVTCKGVFTQAIMQHKLLRMICQRLKKSNWNFPIKKSLHPNIFGRQFASPFLPFSFIYGKDWESILGTPPRKAN
jgi:hypothetical protein